MILLVILGIIIIVVIAFDLAFAVKLEIPVGREGDPQLARPQPDDEPFHIESITLTV